MATHDITLTRVGAVGHDEHAKRLQVHVRTIPLHGECPVQVTRLHQGYRSCVEKPTRIRAKKKGDCSTIAKHEVRKRDRQIACTHIRTRLTRQGDERENFDNRGLPRNLYLTFHFAGIRYQNGVSDVAKPQCRRKKKKKKLCSKFESEPKRPN